MQSSAESSDYQLVWSSAGGYGEHYQTYHRKFTFRLSQNQNTAFVHNAYTQTSVVWPLLLAPPISQAPVSYYLGVERQQQFSILHKWINVERNCNKNKCSAKRTSNPWYNINIMVYIKKRHDQLGIYFMNESSNQRTKSGSENEGGSQFDPRLMHSSRLPLWNDVTQTVPDFNSEQWNNFLTHTTCRHNLLLKIRFMNQQK